MFKESCMWHSGWECVTWNGLRAVPKPLSTFRASHPHQPRKPYILFLVGNGRVQSLASVVSFLPLYRSISIDQIQFSSAASQLSQFALCWSGGYFCCFSRGLLSVHPEPILLTGSTILECLGRLPESVLQALGGLSHVLQLTLLFPRDLTQFCK